MCVHTHTHKVDSHYLRQFRKVAVNAEFMNTEPLLLGRYRARLLWASGHNVFVNGSLHILVLWTFLFKGASFKLYYWFMNIKLTANSALVHAWEQLVWHLSDTCLTFSLYSASPSSCPYNHQTALQHHIWGPFQQWDHQQKGQQCEKHGLNGLWKGYFQHRSRNKTVPCCLVLAQLWTHMHSGGNSFFAPLWKAPWVLIWGLQYSLVSGQVYKYRIWIMNIDLFSINRYRYTHIYTCIYFSMSQPVGFVGENSGWPLW